MYSSSEIGGSRGRDRPPLIGLSKAVPNERLAMGGVCNLGLGRARSPEQLVQVALLQARQCLVGADGPAACFPPFLADSRSGTLCQAVAIIRLDHRNALRAGHPRLLGPDLVWGINRNAKVCSLEPRNDPALAAEAAAGVHT